MQSEATVDREKEIKCLMYMALHLDILTRELLGSENEIAKAVSVVKFMFLHEVRSSDPKESVGEAGQLHH